MTRSLKIGTVVKITNDVELITRTQWIAQGGAILMAGMEATVTSTRGLDGGYTFREFPYIISEEAIEKIISVPGKKQKKKLRLRQSRRETQADLTE